MRTLRTLTVTLVAAAGFGGLGYWAGRQATRPPSDPLPSVAPATYIVVDGDVGRSVEYTALASWPVQGDIHGAAEGTVTAVNSAVDGLIREGDRPVAVNLRPVVVATGTVPMFRQLALNTTGPDVAQLQRFLQRIGQAAVPADGVFGPSTQAGVAAWQQSLGVAGDGTVQPGDLTFVPTLPVRAHLVVKVGQRVTPETSLVELLPAAPTFTMSISDDQYRAIPPGAKVSVRAAETHWPAQLGTTKAGERGVDVELVGADGGPVCAGACAQVSPDHAADYVAVIEVVPPAHGPVVPVGAIHAAADGTRAVTTDHGEVRVRVIAAGDGLAVVDGVQAGDVVVIPAAG